MYDIHVLCQYTNIIFLSNPLIDHLASFIKHAARLRKGCYRFQQQHQRIKPVIVKFTMSEDF